MYTKLYLIDRVVGVSFVFYEHKLMFNVFCEKECRNTRLLRRNRKRCEKCNLGPPVGIEPTPMLFRSSALNHKPRITLLIHVKNVCVFTCVPLHT